MRVRFTARPGPCSGGSTWPHRAADRTARRPRPGPFCCCRPRVSRAGNLYSCPSSSFGALAPMGQRCRCAEVNGSRGLGRSGPAMSALLTHPLPAVWAEQPCPMVFAANTAQVITDRPDDERDMVHRRGTEIGIGASRDDLASHDRRRLGDELAVFVDPEQALGILARSE